MGLWSVCTAARLRVVNLVDSERGTVSFQNRDLGKLAQTHLAVAVALKMFSVP